MELRYGGLDLHGTLSEQQDLIPRLFEEENPGFGGHFEAETAPKSMCFTVFKAEKPVFSTVFVLKHW